MCSCPTQGVTAWERRWPHVRLQQCSCMSHHLWVHKKKPGGEESPALSVKDSFDLPNHSRGQGRFPGRSSEKGKGKLEGVIWKTGAKLEFLIARGLFQEACLSVVYQPLDWRLLDHVSFVNQAHGSRTISFLSWRQCPFILVCCWVGLALLQRDVIGILYSFVEEEGFLPPPFSSVLASPVWHC